MYFASDNAGPAHPRVLEALVAANAGFAPSYGSDPLMGEVREQIRAIFEAPQAEVYLVSTGTAANALALASLAAPWQTVFCTSVAHIEQDECNAPEFFSGGAKLTLVGQGDKMQAEDLAACLASHAHKDVHRAQPGPVSISQVTECGTVYDLKELSALSGIAREAGLPLHMDGARFANALVTLGCSPAEMSWKAGVDVLSLGGTKNGLLGCEAVILFDPAKAWEFELRRKRAGHLFSKHRYLSAQMQAYLAEDLWLQTAAAANDKAAEVAQRLHAFGIALDYPVQANMIFARAKRSLLQALRQGGAKFSLSHGHLDQGDADENLRIRLVCDWSLPQSDIDRFFRLVENAPQ